MSSTPKDHAFHMRRWYLMKNYGLTLDDYQEMLEAQDGRCAICQKKVLTDNGLHVDHDHITDTVRGLLCGNCNRGIGCLKEDPIILASAIAYLERS